LAENDPLLVPLLEATDAETRQDAIDTILVEFVQPVVGQVLSRFRRATISRDDVGDLTATVNVRVLRRLQQFSLSDEPIERLEDYIVAVTYNAVNDLLRRRYPERTRLKSRLRYALLHNEQFALWEIDRNTICGLASWRGMPPIKANFDPAGATNAMHDRHSPVQSLAAVLKAIGGPIVLEDLVAIVMELWQIAETVDGGIPSGLPSMEPGPAMELEIRQSVDAVWNEVCQLRPNQRTALLMNLRDVEGTNGLALILFSHVATFDEIAEAMGLSPERLSEIWNDLPFDDRTIGEMLQLTRQQVINLRKTARERLNRRVNALHKQKRR